MINNTEKEPAQSANCTSSNKKTNYCYDSTETLVCQALEFAKLATELGAEITYKDGVFVIEPRGEQNEQ
ncbi:MAG: hypothetical protein K2F81_00665 [Ruminococcus sp.]|nr:hypothetical protein [Ruminococcus sp.]